MRSSTDLRAGGPFLGGNGVQAEARPDRRTPLEQGATRVTRPYPIDVESLAASHLAEGERRVIQGAARDAVPCFETAVALSPGNRQALLMLAQAQIDAARPAEAELALRALLANNPSDPFAAHLLGALLAEQDRLEEALSWLRLSVEAGPDAPKAFRDLAVVELFTGEIEASRAHFRRALELDAHTQDVLLSLVTITDMAEDTPQTRMLQDVLSSRAATCEDLPAQSRAQILFAQAKACEDRGQGPEAFDWLRRANAVQRSLVVYDSAAHVERLEQVARAFTPALFERLSGEGDPATRPIFILGMPRSGTTLVEQIISAHPEVQGAGETIALLNLVRRAKGPRGEAWPDWAPGMNGDDCRNLARTYLSALPASAPARPRTTDKRLENFEHIGLIHLMLPRAPIIRLIRDPRDVAVSCFSMRFSNNQEWSYDLDEIVRFQRAYERLMDHWESVLPPGRILSVSYEALVADPEPQVRRILDHCGLSWDAACLEFHTSRRAVRTASAAQVRRPIYDTSIGRWRLFAKQMAPWFDALTQPRGG